MLVSTKGRYALRVLADMAENGGENEFIPLKDIADRQEISEKYLEAIVKLLVTDKLLIGHRGKGGGYRLAKAPSKYSVGEILRATEGDIAPVSCLCEGAEKCPRRNECSTIAMWTRLDDMISSYLDGISIADLMEKTASAKKESGSKAAGKKKTDK